MDKSGGNIDQTEFDVADLKGQYTPLGFYLKRQIEKNTLLCVDHQILMNALDFVVLT